MHSNVEKIINSIGFQKMDRVNHTHITNGYFFKDNDLIYEIRFNFISLTYRLDVYHKTDNTSCENYVSNFLTNVEIENELNRLLRKSKIERLIENE